MRADTVKKVAAMPDVPLTEAAIRRMIKRKECPGWYTGNRFIVNIDALLAMLERKSMEAINGDRAQAELAAELRSEWESTI